MVWRRNTDAVPTAATHRDTASSVPRRFPICKKHCVLVSLGLARRNHHLIPVSDHSRHWRSAVRWTNRVFDEHKPGSRGVVTEHAENRTAPTDPNQADDVLAEGVRLIYARATRSYLLVPPVASLLIWMESAAIARSRLIIWACVMAISLSIGLAFSIAFRRTQPAPEAAKRWLHRRIAASVIHGCAWGSSVLLIMPGQDRMELRVLTLAFLVGVTSTLVLTHVGARLAFPAVVIPLWLPAIIVMLTSSGGLSIGIGITTIIYVGVMLHYNSELNRELVAHVRTGVENAALAQRLSGANEEAEAANQRLRTLNESVREMALRDELTGAHNRRYLMQELEREITRADRHGAPLWVAVADLDEFKDVNDLHGHLAGARIAKASAIRSSGKAACIFGLSIAVITQSSTWRMPAR